jgi:predicted RNA-binding Zn-ribbon protein involved in translation (DUF1610 family)
MHTRWGSASIAFFILLFGLGMYGLFTTALYEGEEGLEGAGGLILLLITPIILAIVAAIATGILARAVGRFSKLPGAPPAMTRARWILWIALLLWLLLIVVFPASATIQSDPDNPDGEPFPIGIITVLPVYMGLCLAVYTTGAAMIAWSERNRIETFMVIGLGWAAFGMFLILPAMVSSWNIGGGDVNWDQVIFWLRFGNLFPALLPWIIVLALNWVQGRSIALLEADMRGQTGEGAQVATTRADACPQCGGNLSVHPKTLEVFCAACGWGLASEEDGPIEVDAQPVTTPKTVPVQAEDMFVEQGTPSDPLPSPSPSLPPQQPDACTLCGGQLAALSMTQQVYCTSCGAGLPRAEKPTSPSVPPVEPAPPSAQPGTCTNCGASLTVHPRTQQVFCPACGAGLS